MRWLLRIANAFFWLTVWLAFVVHADALNDPLKMMGHAVIPELLWLIIDIALGRLRAKNSN
jgi:hypothetical protein